MKQFADLTEREILALAISSASLAQVGTTVKEGAKATAEKAKEVGDQTKAAVVCFDS